MEYNDSISIKFFLIHFTPLQDESILKILTYLDLKSLNSVSQVNRYFNGIAHDSLLYTSLNLKPYWPCIDVAVLNNLASKCQYLCKLDLSWCGNYDQISSDNFITFLLTCGSSLTNLRLNCCKFVTDPVVQEVASTCKNIKGSFFLQFQNLFLLSCVSIYNCYVSELGLRNCTNITKNGFSPLITLSHLERLDLYRTLIETNILCSILKENVNMRHLNLASMHERLNMDEISQSLAAYCPNLESIDFWKAHTFTVSGLKLLSNCRSLKEVDFGWW